MCSGIHAFRGGELQYTSSGQNYFKLQSDSANVKKPQVYELQLRNLIATKPSANCILMMVRLIPVHDSHLLDYLFVTSKGFYSFKQRQTRGRHVYVCLILSGCIGSRGKPPWNLTICIRTSIF